MALMKTANLVLMIGVAGGCAMAQNTDVGILVGASQTKISYDIIDNGTPRKFTFTQRAFYLQVNYARQFYESAKGRLYLDLPVSTGDAIFFTPGVRYHRNLTSRVVIYAAAGAGVAVRRNAVRYTVDSTGRGLYQNAAWITSPAYNLGAGVDFRLTRLLSLRGELRRFRTTSVTPAVPNFYGRTFPTAQFGFALHF
jgi:opacity protein-like surface antigen